MTGRIKKLVMVGVVGIVLVGGAAGFYAMRQARVPVAEAADEIVTAASAPGGTNYRLVAEGVVVPVQRAALSAQVGGRAAGVPVAEGQEVEAGGLIVQLENRQQMAAVVQAEAGLKRAQARLDEVQNGAREQEIAAAEAALDGARAQLERIQQGARAEEVRAAEAAVANAQAALNKLLEGSSGPAVIAAQAELANAQAALVQAQSAYDKVKGNPDVGASREALALQQATNAFNAAQARLEDLQRGASKADVDGARARLTQARAQLEALQASARPAEVAAAEAEVRRAEAQLALVRAGARPEQVAAAEADVAAAEATLEQARAALADTEVRAPFAGTIARLDVRVGEQVVPGAVVAQLANLNDWQIETSDLTELHVARVQPGDEVQVAFDALPGVEVGGTVLQVGDLGESNRGEISYKIVVKPQVSEPALRDGLKWNMTAAVEFPSQ